MAFTESLDAFLDEDDFAKAATFTPTTGAASTPNVIFDQAYAEQLGVAGNRLIALGKASVFVTPGTVGGTLVIEGTTYTIREREPIDDGALVALQLVRNG